MKIPYATCHFPTIRNENFFYVDKTHFIAKIESITDNHLVFLRPRRFGKSTLLSTLAHYYDIAKANDFDKLFGGLWIHANPTPQKNAFLVLRLDFSPVASEGTAEEIRSSFATQVKESLRSVVARYVKLIPDLSEIMSVVRSNSVDMAALMTQLFSIVDAAGHRMYLLIDEYDHFGNRLISAGKMSTYRELVDASGFLRSFYAAIKAFTGTGTVARTLITGVSPIVLDDLSSGFNVITHISQEKQFNAMAGFTHSEVEGAVEILLRDNPNLQYDDRLVDRAQLLSILETYYDGYRFSRDASERMYNSTLVLYFFNQVLRNERYPNQMLDLNARTDYGRLYGLARGATENADEIRGLLERILTEGSVNTPLVEQFGTRLPFAGAQVMSLFYYMGMLTFGPNAAEEPIPNLVIPNRVMRELQWEYMGYALADNENIVVDMTHIEQALSIMATEGDVEPLLALFTNEVLRRISNRDLNKFNEKIMKLMLMAYLCQTRVFNVVSEIETKQGYCDLLLGLRSATMRVRYAWIIEAKYVATNAKPETHKKAVDDAYAQIEHYMGDQGIVQMLTLGRDIKAGVMVFVGAKRIDWYPWPKVEKAAAKKARQKKSARK